ncbi:MAG: hypothetical protein HYR84_04590 [Planctomycetes bacterium]|nr:hypothetical protein [Planctomycetota bacterium]
MSGDSIRELIRAQPFQPFEVHLSSGDAYHVTHPEQAFATGASLYIWYPDEGTDHVVRCSLLHITGVEYPERRSKKKGGKS